MAAAVYPTIRYSAVYPLKSDQKRILFAEKEWADICTFADSFAIGMGMAEGEADKIIDHILKHGNQKFVVDADALAVTKECDFKHRAVLTPHIGEMSKLCGLSVSEIKNDSAAICLNYAKKHNCVVLLKSDVSYISDGFSVLKNTTGNPKLAKGGSGDVLSGIIAGLLGQGHSALDSAAAGAYILGRAAELSPVNEYSHLPTDIIASIPNVIAELTD